MAANLAIVITAKDIASNVLKGVGKETESMASRVAGAAKTAAFGITGLGAAMGGIALNAAANFEQTMSGVKAVSGATATEMAQLSSLALQLGKDTVFSAGESGKALEELVKGGVSIADIMGGAAKSTLNLAAAGGVDLSSAAEIAANAMSMFGLKGTDMAMVANQIAGAANASSLGVNDFRLSLQQVGAVAATAGQSFESTAQAIAVMGAAGIKGSDAGTSLKSMFLRLQPETKAATEEMYRLGLLTEDGGNKFFDAAGKVKSMAAISDELKAALEGLTEQQQLSSLQVMFGSDAMRAAAVLSRAGAEGFHQMAAGMGKVTAESVGMERLKNTRGSLEQLKGSAETAAIAFGMAFQPALKGAADKATEMVNAAIPFVEIYGPRLAALLTDEAAQARFWSEQTERLTSFLREHSGVVSVLAGITATVATAYGIATTAAVAHAVATKATMVATNAMAAAQAALNFVMNANPIVKVVTLLAGLVAALFTAYQTNEDFRNAVNSAWETIRSTGETVFGAVGVAMDNMGKTIGDTWETIKTSTRDAINVVIGFINQLISNWNALEFRIPGFDVELPSADIPGVGRVGGGSLGWGGVTIGTPDIPTIPVLDMGAIVRRPTLAMLAANNRPEAVVPLGSGGRTGGITVNINNPVLLGRSPDIAEELARLLEPELNRRLVGFTRM